MSDSISIPRRFLTDFLASLNFHNGHGTPSFDRIQAVALSAEAKALLAAPSAITPLPGTVYLIEGKPHLMCGCDPMSNVCQRTGSGTRKLATFGFSECLIPVNSVLMTDKVPG